MPNSERSSRTLKLTWLAWCGLIAYGSLLPFEWRAPPPQGAVFAFLNMPWLNIGLGGRIDWLANLLIYVPAGLLGCLALLDLKPSAAAPMRHRLPIIALWVFFLVCLMATGIEFAQICVAPRTVSLNDLLAEFVGTALGCLGAMIFGRSLARLLQRASSTSVQSHLAWLQVYALAYCALSFFPFDFSAASAVFQQKVLSGHAGWWWAPYQQGGHGGTLLKLGLEAALVAPFGLALAGSPRQLSWQRALVGGLLLGAVIELVQLFLLSAVSQGVSVASRAAGMAGGAALAPHWPRIVHLLTPTRVRWATLMLAIPWLAATAYLAGWGRVGVRLTDWRQQAENLNYLPFYYHYFVGEARALTSLLQVVASFAVIGICLALGWPRARAIHAAVCAGIACLAVEASKLLLVAQRPDPTNVLIAAASAAAAWAVASKLHGALPTGTSTAPPRATCDDSQFSTALISTPAPAGATLWALGAASVILFSAWAADGQAWGTALAVATYAVCIWHHPAAALMLMPVALALTDLASFEGHRWLELVDWLTLTSLIVATAKPPGGTDLQRSVRADWLGLALGLLLIPAVAVSLRSATWPDPNALLSPLSPWRALLLAKGIVAAFVLAWYTRRFQLDAAAAARWFGRGMVLALAGVVMLTVLERLSFVGMRDFTSEYRAPGPFSAIALGGAYIEAFLAAAVPFAVVAALHERQAAARWACWLLVVAAAYATMVTYSRGGQVVFLAAVGATFLWALIQRQPVARLQGPGSWFSGVTLVIAVSILAGVILWSPYAASRFGRLNTDAQSRWDHWAQGMALRQSGTGTLLLGSGLASFGRQAYVQSPPAGRPSMYQLRTESGDLHVHTAPGSLSYLDQRVQVQPGEALTLRARLRNTEKGKLQALLCEKDLVQSRRCGVASMTVAEDGLWHPVQLALTLPASPHASWPARPIRFTLFQAGKAEIDIDDVSLRDSKGRELLRNGSFEQGSAHWLYSSDMHLVWHLKNLWLQVYFEQGLAGIAAYAGLLVAGLAGAWRGAKTHSPWLIAVALALLALQGVGLIDSVIDSPRFLQLFLTLALLAWILGYAPQRTRT